MSRQPINTSGVLSNKEVEARRERCLQANLCYISLAPLTDETKASIIGMRPDGTSGVLFFVHNKYAETTLLAMNR